MTYVKLNGNGAWVENKQRSLTFHYRDVPQAEQASYHERATRIIETYGFVANPAHAAVEAKPPVVWNKGTAVCVSFINRNINEIKKMKKKIIFQVRLRYIFCVRSLVMTGRKK